MFTTLAVFGLVILGWQTLHMRTDSDRAKTTMFIEALVVVGAALVGFLWLPLIALPIANYFMDPKMENIFKDYKYLPWNKKQ